MIMISIATNYVRPVDKKGNLVPRDETDKKYAQSRLIDGLEVYDALCPVSKKTGLRENITSLVSKLATDPAKARLLEAALQEIPADTSQSGLSDADKVETLAMRFATGTPAENEAFRNNVLEPLLELRDSSFSSPVPAAADPVDTDKQIVDGV